jgi:hypothetical protein
MLTPTPSNTPVIPRLEETPFAESGINITSPKDGQVLVQGDQIHVGGLIQIGDSESLTVVLESAAGRELAEAEVEVHQFGNWDGVLTLPVSYSGSARINAKIISSEDAVLVSDTQSIFIETDLSLTDQYLVLYRPSSGEYVAAGYNMFFDGEVQRPVNNLITISLWGDDCQSRIGRQSFQLRGSGYWQGFLVIPANASGPACAVAHFGEPEEEGYREAQIAVEILPAGSDEAYGVLIGNPPPQSTAEAGKTLLLFGTAYNAPEGEVRITIQSIDGRLITEGIAESDPFGYWELSLYIPDETEGTAEIRAEIGVSEDDDFAGHSILVDFISGE